MKKSLYLIVSLAMAALVSFSSCIKVNPINPSEIRDVTLNATTDDASKTYLSGTSVLWKDGDKINVNGSTFNLTSGAGSKDAAFQGSVSGTSFLAGYKAKDNNGTTVTFEIPANQSNQSNSPYFLDGKLPMAGYASSENVALKFKNVVNILKIGLKTGSSQTNIVTNIELTSTTDITGDISATYNSSTGKIEATSINNNGGKTITVSFNPGITLTSTAQYVYVIIPKFASTSDITVKMTGTIAGDPGKFTGKIQNVPGGTVSTMYPVNITATLESVPYFTVGSGKKVEFSPGNLYYKLSDDAFYFGTDQTYYSTSTTFEYHDHLAWSKSKYFALYRWGESTSENDIIFTNSGAETANPDFKVNDESGWRCLSNTEVNHLINVRNNNKKLCGEVIVNGKNGFLILPDNMDPSYVNSLGLNGPSQTFKNISTYWDAIKTKAVFIPFAGQGNFNGNQSQDSDPSQYGIGYQEQIGSIQLSNTTGSGKGYAFCFFPSVGSQYCAYFYDSGCNYRRTYRLVRNLN